MSQTHQAIFRAVDAENHVYSSGTDTGTRDQLLARWQRDVDCRGGYVDYILWPVDEPDAHEHGRLADDT